MMMRSAPSTRRAGISLTEILIAIFIMGVGLVSLATLFPLGLLRMRAASQESRSALLAESAMAEVNARDVLSRNSFALCGWYPLNPFGSAAFANYDPTIQDTTYGQTAAQNPTAGGVYAAYGGYVPSNATFTTATPTAGTTQLPYVAGPGLPFCYDPLWWSVTHYTTFGGTNVANPGVAAAREAARFGLGTGFLRADPGGGTPSAYGLQRLTNFRPLLAAADNWPLVYPVPDPTNRYRDDILYGNGGLTPDVASSTFSSPDDILFNSIDGQSQATGAPSPVLPDANLSSIGAITRDLEYTWFLTLQRSDGFDNSSYSGSVVVSHRRSMGLQTITTPSGGTATVAQGERVVEAVWGYSSNRTQATAAPATFYATADRNVLIRWIATDPDPIIRPGSFVADVTYERNFSVDVARFRTSPGQAAQWPPLATAGDTIYPGQRCEWYRIASATTPTTGRAFTGDGGTAFREMILTLESPVRYKTRLDGTNSPVHINAALLMPSVVNVFPRSFITRD